MTKLTDRAALAAGREAEAIAWLARLLLATREQLSALAWPDMTQAAARSRLRRLVKVGLIRWLPLAGESHTPGVYRLTRAGIEAAALLAKDPELARALARARPEIQLEHRLATVDAVVELVRRLAGVEVVYPHERRLRWKTGGGWREVTSDAIVLTPALALLIEFDCGTRSLRAVGRQIRRYDEARQDPTLPDWPSTGSVIYLLHPPSPRRAEAILDAAAAVGMAGRVAVVAADDFARVIPERLRQQVSSP